MRLILVLILIAAIFALIQTKRHNCEFGTDGWFDCVIQNSKREFFAGPVAPAPQVVALSASR